MYEYQCYSCDPNYIGYTSRHFHLRIEEHKYSVIGKHLKNKHNQRPTNLHEHFAILKKCHRKFECLIYEMLLIREKRPTLNTQTDFIPAKLFISIFPFSCFSILLFIPPRLFYVICHLLSRHYITFTILL